VTKITFKRHSKLSEILQYDRVHMISCYCSIVTVAVTSIVSHIQPDTGRKSQNLYTQSVFYILVRGDPVGISQKCLAWGNI